MSASGVCHPVDAGEFGHDVVELDADFGVGGPAVGDGLEVGGVPLAHDADPVGQGGQRLAWAITCSSRLRWLRATQRIVLGLRRAQQHLTAGAYTSLMEALDHVRIDLALQVE